MDRINRKILAILQEDARIPFSALGKEVGLSAPAVAERVRKLQDGGVIEAFRADIRLEEAGLVIQAFVQAKVFQGMERDFVAMARGCPQVLECHNLTGEKAYLMKVAVSSMRQMDQMLENFTTLAETNTMVILSTPKERPAIPELLADF